MAGLLFLSRVSVICNLFFVICLLLRHTHFTIPDAGKEFVIITGWILSVFLNFLFILVTAFYSFKKRPMTVPFALVFINIAFFIFQVIYRFFFSF